MDSYRSQKERGYNLVDNYTGYLPHIKFFVQAVTPILLTLMANDNEYRDSHKNVHPA